MANQEHPYETTFKALAVTIEHMEDDLGYAEDSQDYIKAVTQTAYRELGDDGRMAEETEQTFAQLLTDLADEAETVYEGKQSVEQAAEQRDERMEKAVEDAAQFKVKGSIGGTEIERTASEADAAHHEARTRSEAYRKDLEALTSAMRMVARTTDDTALAETIREKAREYEPGEE